MNWKTFFAMLARDGHVARRNLIPTLVQNLLQPLLLTFVFGRVLTASGMMSGSYKNILLPGIMALSMTLSGIWAVAMPLISEFQFTKEIEDRLLAPMDTSWLAVEKVVAGMLQALFSGLVVIPAAWLTLGSGVNLGDWRPAQFIVTCLLMALFSAAGGLWMGVQCRPNADRPHVQHGDHPHDDVRLRLLPMERARFLPGPEVRSADQSAGLRQ